MSIRRARSADPAVRARATSAQALHHRAHGGPTTYRAKFARGRAKEVQRDGYAGLSLSAVAEEADESKASIGYYFGNKEGLVVALVDSLVHEANRGLVAETHRYPMGEQRLRALDLRRTEDDRRTRSVSIAAGDIAARDP